MSLLGNSIKYLKSRVPLTLSLHSHSKAYCKDEFLIKPSLLHPCYEQKLLLIPSVFKSSRPVAFAGMLFKMVWSWSTSFLALMASSRFFATSAPGNSPNRKLEAIQKKSWQLHLQPWFDLSVGHHHIHFRIAKSLIAYDSYCVEVISHICDSMLVVWGCAALTTAILDKINGTSGPPLPSISMMPKWRVFAPSRLHSCFWGGGMGVNCFFLFSSRLWVSHPQKVL